MESELKELIFDTNSTTLKTLSELEVVDIAQISAKTDQNATNITYLNQQVNSLGQTVIKNQSDTNAMFATVNNEITLLQNGIETLTDDVGYLKVADRVLTEELATLGDEVDTLTSKVTNLETTIGSFQSQIDTMNGEITALAEIVNTLDAIANQALSLAEQAIIGAEDWMDNARDDIFMYTDSSYTYYITENYTYNDTFTFVNPTPREAVVFYKDYLIDSETQGEKIVQFKPAPCYAGNPCPNITGKVILGTPVRWIAPNNAFLIVINKTKP